MEMTRLAITPYSLLPRLSTLFSSVSPSTSIRNTTPAKLTRRHVCLLSNKCFRLTARAVESANWAPSSDTGAGVWEEPDDGTDSDYEDEEEGEDGEEAEENDLDFESDWEEDETGAASSTAVADKLSPSAVDDDKIVSEVEPLLTPEELAILYQNDKPDLSKISTAKWKPLQSLALSGAIQCMDKLIDNGVDIDSVDKDGLTALHKAIIGRKEHVISHLLRKGASPHVRDRDGATPLHYAVQVGAIHIVKLLIKYKVDVNVADMEGWTPLHVAVQSRNRDITKVLLVNGADKTRRNQDGKTPLELSISFGKEFKSYDIAMLLKVVPYNRDL